MSRSPISIKRRMLWILLGAFAVVWLSVATLTFTNLRREVKDVFDTQLAQAARVLSNLVRDEIAEMLDTGVVDVNAVAIHNLEPDFMFQVLLDDRTVLRSPNAPDTPIWDKPGYRTLHVSGERWRVLRYEETGNAATIIVAGRRDVRAELVQNVAVEVLWPLLLALPILAIAILLGVRQALRPLRQVREEIRRRNPDQLEPLDTNRVPKEIRQVILAMNALFQRLAAMVERERRFTADAAHELRTPLAALKAQAHVAQSAKDEARRQKAIQNISAGVDRTAKLVEQLLTLARLDPPHAETRRDLIDVSRTCGEILEAFALEAEAKRLTLSLHAPSGAWMQGDAAAIAILIRNLVDNAIRYSPEGGEVTVTVTDHDSAVILSVADHGPGIPEDQQQAVFERFYRIDGSKADGSGLGLSIARRVAELHHADIKLANREGGGLLVSVRFARAA